MAANRNAISRVLMAGILFIVLVGGALGVLSWSGALGRDIALVAIPKDGAKSEDLRSRLAEVSEIQQWGVETGGAVATKLWSRMGPREIAIATTEAGFIPQRVEVGYDIRAALVGRGGKSWLVALVHVGLVGVLVCLARYMAPPGLSSSLVAPSIAFGTVVWAAGWAAQWAQSQLPRVPEVASPFEGWARTQLAILAVLVAPIVEEAFFRGLLFFQMQKRNAFVAALVSSAAFGLAHGSLLLIVPTMIMGMLLCGWFRRTQSWLACAIAHATSNLAALAQMWLL